jgi:hypothetical protein
MLLALYCFIFLKSYFPLHPMTAHCRTGCLKTNNLLPALGKLIHTLTHPNLYFSHFPLFLSYVYCFPPRAPIA